MMEIQDQYMTGVLLLLEFWGAANEKAGSLSYELNVYLPSTWHTEKGGNIAYER